MDEKVNCIEGDPEVEGKGSIATPCHQEVQGGDQLQPRLQEALTRETKHSEYLVLNIFFPLSWILF